MKQKVRITRMSLESYVRLIAVISVLCFEVSGCLRPGQERALLDLEVGFAQADGIEFEVEEGLGAIREVKYGEVEIWAQAPVLRIHARLSKEAIELWSISVCNCMPRSELYAESIGGEQLDVELVENPIPTQKRWRVCMHAGQEILLTLSPPNYESHKMWRFGVLSDIQEAVDKVQDIFDIMNQDTELQFIVSSGDLTVAGRESQLTRIQEKLKGLNVPFFSTVGNHEMGVRNPYLWHKLFGRHSFHFQYRGVHFSLIDSASASVDPMVYDFLDDWIEISIAQTHIFVTHVPPLDPVSVRSHAFRSRREAAKLLTRLARGHVDVTLYGHIHSYYAFSNAGIPAYISGGGGATPEQMDGIGRHYLTVEVSADQGVKSVFAVRVPD